jgi:hypothetical protein
MDPIQGFVDIRKTAINATVVREDPMADSIDTAFESMFWMLREKDADFTAKV